jgi:alpha-galactosidase
MRLACLALLLPLLAVPPVRAAAGPGPILTPPAPAAARIHGPTLFGVRPGSPFLYRIPATGQRPIAFSVVPLPPGLALDPASGQITGRLSQRGNYDVVLRARNAAGEDQRKFRIVVGDAIALTPAMGWNSWNCWAGSVDQSKVLAAARAMVASGLADHGWTYINIDDTWQGPRTGPGHALSANGKFPDMAALCDAIHQLGLKAGIYSTPWMTSYARYPGGSSDDAAGAWSKAWADRAHYRFGQTSFAAADARQWAAWGFDYLKYDWFPNDVPHVAEMSAALRASGRDMVYSLSNAAPLAHAADWARLANSWRTTGDIRDEWTETPQNRGFYGTSEIGFAQDPWAPFAGPGHWNDPDMLVVGRVGWSAQLHDTHLTADEQYAHISLWCLLSAPLLIGCDLNRLDPFTLGLLANDEVLALDQDALGRQAVRVATLGAVDVYAKDLEDGSRALGFFNRGDAPVDLAFTKLRVLGFAPRLHVRDLWRQQDQPDLTDLAHQPLRMNIPAHGVMLYRISAAD